MNPYNQKIHNVKRKPLVDMFMPSKQTVDKIVKQKLDIIKVQDPKTKRVSDYDNYTYNMQSSIISNTTVNKNSYYFDSSEIRKN